MRKKNWRDKVKRERVGVREKGMRATQDSDMGESSFYSCKGLWWIETVGSSKTR